jgi:hypothetical protein
MSSRRQKQVQNQPCGVANQEGLVEATLAGWSSRAFSQQLRPATQKFTN